MFSNVFNLLGRPWFLYLCSFVLMTGLACPKYRLMGGSSVGFFGYWTDSALSAIAFPGVIHPALGVLVWIIALVALRRSRTTGNRVAPFFMLILLWVLYFLGRELMNRG